MALSSAAARALVSAAATLAVSPLTFLASARTSGGHPAGFAGPLSLPAEAGLDTLGFPIEEDILDVGGGVVEPGASLRGGGGR